jgi:hypothetical protein|tara:strand:- start:672 stop:1211 length:540 start_codon:yes stop_codon:yes gene_type:complete
MKSRYHVLIKPVGSEYNNIEKIGDKELLVNTSIEDVNYVNRLGEVIYSPDNDLEKGDIVVIHHNVFRLYYDMKGNKRRSNEYFRDNMYLVPPDKIYMYKRNNKWNAYKEYCFISPVEFIQDSTLHRIDEKEEKHVGVVKYSNAFKPGDKIGFSKNSEYEFTIDKEKLYRMRNRDICIKL